MKINQTNYESHVFSQDRCECWWNFRRRGTNRYSPHSSIPPWPTLRILKLGKIPEMKRITGVSTRGGNKEIKSEMFVGKNYNKMLLY